MGEVNSGEWVGVIDAWTQLRKGGQIEDMRWEVECRVEKTDKDDPIEIMVFDVNKLNKKVFKGDEGKYIRQCLYAHWLEDSCNGMNKLDMKTIKIYENMKHVGPKPSRSTLAYPSSRIARDSVPKNETQEDLLNSPRNNKDQGYKNEESDDYHSPKATKKSKKSKKSKKKKSKNSDN